MFNTIDVPIDTLEQAFQQAEVGIRHLRARQLALINALDESQVTMMDGARTMTDWVAARLDAAPEEAARLTKAARLVAQHQDFAIPLAEGAMSLDRAIETARLANAGASEELIRNSHGFDIAGVRRLTAARTRMTPKLERDAQSDRRFVRQPTLDHTGSRYHGFLAGQDDEIFARALEERAESFPPLPDGRRAPVGQRYADALVSFARHALDGETDSGGSRVPLVSVFVDAELTAQTRGEAGVMTAGGNRIGPNTLDEILCEAFVEVNTTGAKPLAVGPAGRTVSPRLKRFILHRDGGCVIDGCQSRYRLQPHHIIPRSRGGTNDPRNLATLCWFHHHVVVHTMGYEIDPDSPPQRRRFLRSGESGPDPP
jgi:hypothetical protein